MQRRINFAATMVSIAMAMDINQKTMCRDNNPPGTHYCQEITENACDTLIDTVDDYTPASGCQNGWEPNSVSESIVGWYENESYRGSQYQNDYHFVSIKTSHSCADTFVWTNAAGVQWQLTQDVENKELFYTHADCPYYDWPEGEETKTAKVHMDDNGETVVGITGPGGEYYDFQGRFFNPQENCCKCYGGMSANDHAESIWDEWKTNCENHKGTVQSDFLNQDGDNAQYSLYEWCKYVETEDFITHYDTTNGYGYDYGSGTTYHEGQQIDIHMSTDCGESGDDEPVGGAGDEELDDPVDDPTGDPTEDPTGDPTEDPTEEEEGDATTGGNNAGGEIDCDGAECGQQGEDEDELDNCGEAGCDIEDKEEKEVDHEEGEMHSCDEEDKDFYLHVTGYTDLTTHETQSGDYLLHVGNVYYSEQEAMKALKEKKGDKCDNTVLESYLSDSQLEDVKEFGVPDILASWFLGEIEEIQANNAYVDYITLLYQHACCEDLRDAMKEIVSTVDMDEQEILDFEQEDWSGTGSYAEKVWAASAVAYKKCYIKDLIKDKEDTDPQQKVEPTGPTQEEINTRNEKVLEEIDFSENEYTTSIQKVLTDWLFTRQDQHAAIDSEFILWLLNREEGQCQNIKEAAVWALGFNDGALWHLFEHAMEPENMEIITEPVIEAAKSVWDDCFGEQLQGVDHIDIGPGDVHKLEV